jgi:hypothetical protein
MKMKQHEAVWKKMMKVSWAGIFAVAPLAVSTAPAQAAPPSRPHPGPAHPPPPHPGPGHPPPPPGQRPDHRPGPPPGNSRPGRYQTFTGQASNVKDRQFDLRVGGSSYDVYASSRLPNGLRSGDTVRVYGQRYGNNDIRNANVTVIRKGNNPGNWGNNNNSWGEYRTFSGTVTKIDSRSKFEVRIGNDTYDVYPSGLTPRQLSRNDVVRIYGRRYGNNDIRNANVVIVQNR